MLPFLISTAFGLEFSPCHPKGLGMQVNCATLSVVVQSKTLEIPLIHIPAVKNTSRPPIFILAGGPGQAATEIGPTKLSETGIATICLSCKAKKACSKFSDKF